jgi:SAM-dependent methyltransferase
MGLADILAARLTETVKKNDLKGACLMLGRQRWGGRRTNASAEVFDEVFAEYMPGVAQDELKNPNDQYSETFFRLLGFDTIDSLDFSEFEGASIIQDLAGELSPNLREAFDVIYDGGVCEHIFDLPTAYRNIHAMLKPGGTFIAHSPGNNWPNHGFYQICPAIVYSFWASSLNYEVLECVYQPLRPHAARNVITMSNPLETGRRPRLASNLPPNSPIILNYVVRKPLGSAVGEQLVNQSDYTRRWDAAT